MTTPSVDRPVSVEPMTPIRALATLRRWGDYLRAENSVLHTRAGIIISADAIDTVLSVAAKAHSRALPAPRRYTGGPLPDGVYLWRRDRWRPTAWRMALVEDGEPERLRSSLPDPGDWIIGPVPLPIIPSEDTP